VASLTLLFPFPAAANDSAAAIGIGGLTLTQNNAISMDEEDLFLSQNEVRVRYRFTNHSNHDVETLVSFPVPALPGGVADYLGDRDLPDFRELKFQTTVDGKPVKLDYVERVEANSRDVTKRIAQLGWPARWNLIDYDQKLAFLDTMSEKDKQAYIEEGLLRIAKEYDNLIVPNWDLVTYVTRKQVFPAGRTVEVTHRYIPMTGGAVGGGLEPEYRAESDYYKGHVKTYCMDKAFIAALDRRLVKRPDGNPSYMEVWMRYILSSGANWRGPIGAFRLVIDKGKPDSLVSFCMDGVKKISPTQFEVRKTNFEPTRDIDVLIIEWRKPGE
jgi:hypothetical protein